MVEYGHLGLSQPTGSCANAGAAANSVAAIKKINADHGGYLGDADHGVGSLDDDERRIASL